MLAHELCHVRRRDNLFAAIHMVVEAVFWFHPFVWWIGARLIEERERACDEGVLTLGNEPRTYADAILNVCKSYVESPLVCVAGVTGADLKKRIEAIMTNRIGQGLTRAKRILLAATGVAALAGPVAIGVLIAAGNAPAIRAHPFLAAVAPGETAQAAFAAPVNPQAQPATAPSPEFRYTDHRLMALLLDLDAMNPDDQARSRERAISFVQNSVHPDDSVAVMSVSGGKVTVAQDFTADKAALESAIQKLSPGDPGGAANGTDRRLAVLQVAVQMLGSLPGNKALVYLSGGSAGLALGDQAQMTSAMNAAVRAGVALFPIDLDRSDGALRFGASQVNGASAVPTPPQPGGRGAGWTVSPTPPAGVSQEEYNRRVAYAREHFASASAPARFYINYGPPDRIDDQSSDAQNPRQIWRYNYLESFRSNVEVEFRPGSVSPRVNWPPPLQTYTGTPELNRSLAEALSREKAGQEGSTAANLLAGLPGRRATMGTYPPEARQVLTVPLDTLSGRVDIIAQITTSASTGESPTVAATMRDMMEASAGPDQTAFMLQAGSYDCKLLVREQSTGRLFGEIIHFEVK